MLMMLLLLLPLTGPVFPLKPTPWGENLSATDQGRKRCVGVTETWAMKKSAPGWLGYIGDKILPRYIGIIS